MADLMQMKDYLPLVLPLVKKLTESLYSSATQFLRPKKDFEKLVERYLRSAIRKYGYTKTLLYRSKPVLVTEFYVPATLEIAGRKKTTERLMNIFEISQNLLITGLAGSGKSIFSRSIFLEMISNGNWGIPFFIELRNLSAEKPYLENTLIKILEDNGNSLSRDELGELLSKGSIKLLLDGFDEVDHKNARSVASEIISFGKKYQNINIIVTSRPDEFVQSLENFSTVKINPLDLNSAVTLINKLDYDSVVKKKFISELKGGLFRKHESFLSNPLLLTIMLMTFEQIADIPGKMHIFYDQAFDVLFNKHDATKSMYKRKHFTALPIDDFKTALSGFSILTFFDRKFKFSESECLEYLDKTKRLVNLEYNKVDYLKDLVCSTCILIKDGMEYAFSHRSFQEYFAALFISKSTSSNRGKLLKKTLSNALFDHPIDLLFEINRELVEFELLIPEVQKINKHITAIPDGEDRYIEILKLFWSTVSSRRFEKDGKPVYRPTFGITRTEDRAIVLIKLKHFYREEWKQIYQDFKISMGTEEDPNQIIEERNIDFARSPIEDIRIYSKRMELDKYVNAVEYFLKNVEKSLLEKRKTSEDNILGLIE